MTVWRTSWIGRTTCSTIRTRTRSFSSPAAIPPTSRMPTSPPSSGYSRKPPYATIPDAGHWVHAEQPQAFYRAVADFLAD